MNSALLLSLFATLVSSIRLVDVFNGGDGGYKCFRIPALIQTSNSTLLLFAEGRKNSCNDHGFVDLVYKSSHDDGATWGDVVLVRRESSPSKNVTIGNPAPVALSGNRVLLPFCRENLAAGVLYSPDGGTSWELRANLTIPPTWTWIATGPPASLQLPSGRILIPSNKIDASVDGSFVFYSDDEGLTWGTSSNFVSKGNEDQAVSLPWVSPKTVLLSMRNAGGPTRLAALSTDEGMTWGDTWETIVEGECQASTIALPTHPDGPLLAMSSPFNSARRVNMTIHVSTDDGKSWAPKIQVYAGGSAYSSLIQVSPTSVGLAFEKDGYASIAFATGIEL